jgi:hypothetical protein
MKRKTISIVLAAALLLTTGLATTLPVGAATEEEIEDSIEAGIAWLASVQNGDGSWGSDYYQGTTGLILVKLQDRAFELGFDGPFDDGYPLKPNVVAGLDFLFLHADTVAISAQIAGDPDSNGNGLGVSVYGQTYYTAILMMAIAAGRDPSRVVATGPLTGWTYGDVLQDLVDWTAYAQADTGAGRGGWFYNAMNEDEWADQSNSGYAVLGLLYAQAPLYSYESDIPGFVATELNYWIDYIQNDVGVGDPQYDGGSAYCSDCPEDYWVNSLKTGNLLTQMAFVGDTVSDTRVQDALDYIGLHWEDDWVQGWGKSGPVQYQATYCLMKGFEAMGVPLNGVPGVADWYQDMADAILAEQDIAGYWPSNPAYVWSDASLGYIAEPELATVWVLLTLERFAPHLIPPTKHCTPKFFFFGAMEDGENPQSKTLTIYNFGAEGCAPLEWTVSDGADWLTLSPTSGTTMRTMPGDQVDVSVDISGMTAGMYFTWITIEAPGATNTPQQLPVFLHVQPIRSSFFWPC